MNEIANLSTPPRLVEACGAYSILLRQAFDQICNPNDWRAEIDCLVPWEAANVYMQAIQYMTATSATCERLVRDGATFAHLTSVGYRRGPAGA